MVSAGLFRDRSAPLVRVGVHPSSTCRRRKTSPMSFVIGLGVVLACPGEEHHERKRSSLDMADTDQGRQGQQSRTTGILKAGTPAPEFTLNTTPDQRVALSDFRGQPVVLAFYPADWSPVCGDQMTLYNEILPEFRKHNAALLGISVDGVWCHGAFAQARRLNVRLLADFEPKGAVARTYGAYRKREGVAERALFVLDPTGIIHWSYVSPVGVNPGANGILSSLEDLQT